MARSTPRRPPSRLLLLAEGRAFFELAAGVAFWPLLQVAPRGDGHPVLVLPGFLASDASTLFLRSYLRGMGYDAQGWNLGLNLGHRREVEAAAIDLLGRMSDGGRRKVSIVGWSLGGTLARLIAAREPELVRSVISLGSPISGSAGATNASFIFRGLKRGQSGERTLRRRVVQDLPMPSTSIYSRSDGVVAWRISTLPEAKQAENIEVHGSHLGLGANPAVLYAIADRLAQRQGAWRSFSRAGIGAIVYPDPMRPA